MTQKKNTIEEQNWFNNRQVIAIVAFFVGVTFSLSMIYARFTYMEQHIKIVEQRLDKKIKILNEIEHRLDELEHGTEEQ